MEAFQHTLEDCGCSDLGYRGPKFTWNNCREGSFFTKERLDWVVANQGWCELYHGAKVSMGVAICSDHSPVFLQLKGQGYWQQRQHKFSFEAGWELESKCHDIIAQAWSER